MTAKLQAGAGHQVIGVAEPIDGHQLFGAGAVAGSDQRKAVAGLHHVLIGLAVHPRAAGGGAGWPGAHRNAQPGAAHHQVGILQPIELDQALGAGVETIGDFREGFAVLHGVRSRGLGADAAATATATTASAAWNREALAGDDQIGIADAVGLEQAGEADAVPIGDLGEGFTRAHHNHLLSQRGRGQQARQRQGHRHGQGCKGAAHRSLGELGEP